MPSRFRFHGYAIGAAGQIRKPYSEVIEVQAASALPQIGGHGSSRVCHFKYREILKFDLAHTEVTGEPCDCNGDGDKSFGTRITSTVEGLNVMGMVTADRVVATLSSTYTADSDGEPSVRLIGTRFENLRIAGIPIDVDLATDVFDRYDTHRSLASAYKAGDKVKALIDQLSLKDRASEAPPHILRWFSELGRDGGMPASRGITAISLVRGIESKGSSLDCWGHVIHLPGFGTIRLAEIEISSKTRNVNMIQVDLDCPYKGHLMLCSIADGGDDY